MGRFARNSDQHGRHLVGGEILVCLASIFAECGTRCHLASSKRLIVRHGRYKMQIDSLVLAKFLGKKPPASISLPRISLGSQCGKYQHSEPCSVAGFSRAMNPTKTLATVAGCFDNSGVRSFPVFFGISSTADEVVDLVLRRNWNSAAFPLAILSPIVALQMLGSAIIPALSGSGHPIVNLRQRMVSSSYCCLEFFGIPWGLMASQLAPQSPMRSVSSYKSCFACPVLGLTIREYLGAVSSPLAAASLMYMIVNISRFALSDSIGKYDSAAINPGGYQGNQLLCGGMADRP